MAFTALRHTLTVIVLLASALMCAPATAEETPHRADPPQAVLPAPVAALRVSPSVGAPGTMLLRRATRAVFAAAARGLVLLDVSTKGSDSCLYIKFEKNGMAQLRWLTRF